MSIQEELSKIIDIHLIMNECEDRVSASSIAIDIINYLINYPEEVHTTVEAYRKTCVNCKHYHPVLNCAEDDFHIHDWCSVWNAKIPDSIIFDRIGYETGYTDIECGITSCSAFEVKHGQLKYQFPKMGD